jgi:hypothetical protein
MTCEEYRAAIAADPSFDGGAGHLSECVACQSYRREMQALDETICRALMLDVPELRVPELPEVIAEVSPKTSALTTDNVVSLPRRRSVSPTWLAVAATVVVAALLGLRILGPGTEYAPLGEQVLAHIDHEAASLQVTNVAVSDEQLSSVVTEYAARMNHGAGLITYARSCEINGRDVPHLVIQGEYGPVTILLMPYERIQQAETLSGEHLNGIILPVGDGSIAIVGPREERLESIQKRVIESVTWST